MMKKHLVYSLTNDGFWIFYRSCFNQKLFDGKYVKPKIKKEDQLTVDFTISYLHDGLFVHRISDDANIDHLHIFLPRSCLSYNDIYRRIIRTIKKAYRIHAVYHADPTLLKENKIIYGKYAWHSVVITPLKNELQ